MLERHKRQAVVMFGTALVWGAIAVIVEPDPVWLYAGTAVIFALLGLLDLFDM